MLFGSFFDGGQNFFRGERLSETNERLIEREIERSTERQTEKFFFKKRLFIIGFNEAADETVKRV